MSGYFLYSLGSTKVTCCSSQFGTPDYHDTLSSPNHNINALSHTPHPYRGGYEVPSRTPPAPRPVPTPKTSQPQQTVGPASRVAEKGSGSKYDDSTDSDGGPRKGTDLPSEHTPNAKDSNPLHDPGSKSSSESGEKAKPRKRPNQSRFSPISVNGDQGPDAELKADPQINSVTYQSSRKEAGSSDPSILRTTNEEPRKGVDARPDSQSGTNRDPGQVAASDLDSGGHSSPDSPTNVATSSDYTGQVFKTTQDNSLAISNQNLGETATIGGQIVQPLSGYAISIAGTTLMPGASPITVSSMKVSLRQSALVVGCDSVPVALLADSVLVPDQVTRIDDPSTHSASDSKKGSSAKTPVETLEMSMIEGLSSAGIPSGANLAASASDVRTSRGHATALQNPLSWASMMLLMCAALALRCL